MQYTVDREEGAVQLNMSTRTVDRYIRAGKIRSKKIGKKVFLHAEDVERISQGGIQEEYQILHEPKAASPAEKTYTPSTRPQNQDLMKIYQEFQGLIAAKDEALHDLSYRLGQAEESLKASIPVAEHKKTTFLLETAKVQLEEEKKLLSYQLGDLDTKLKKEQTGNMFLT